MAQKSAMNRSILRVAEHAASDIFSPSILFSSFNCTESNTRLTSTYLPLLSSAHLYAPTRLGMPLFAHSGADHSILVWYQKSFVKGFQVIGSGGGNRFRRRRSRPLSLPGKVKEFHELLFRRPKGPEMYAMIDTLGPNTSAL